MIKDELFSFFKYPDSIQKSIYTTNWIERVNKEIRKRLKTMNSLPNKAYREFITYKKSCNEAIVNYRYKLKRFMSWLVTVREITESVIISLYNLYADLFRG